MKSETKKIIIAGVIWTLALFSIGLAYLESSGKFEDGVEDTRPLYRVDPQLEPYLELFVDLAELKGIDLTYIYDQPITIRFYNYKPDNDNNVAASYARDKDAIVILVDREKFSNRSEEGKKYVMFHEFGHDILNFEHLERPDRGMMEPTAYSGFFGWDYVRFSKKRQQSYLYKSLNQMFNRYLGLPDDATNWN